MARIARHVALLALPVDAPFTPGTFDQVIVSAQLRELCLDYLVPSLKVKICFKQLAALRQHIGICSSAMVCC